MVKPLYRCETYSPKKHTDILSEYIRSTHVANNKSAKALRLNEYNDIDASLFLVIDTSDKIKALCAVFKEQTPKGPAAKIYCRLEIVPTTSHSVIDRFLEPATFQWCLDREIENIFLTINEGNYRVLDWASRRMGERRNSKRPNSYFPQLGNTFRRSLQPHKELIFERGCWQYCIFVSKTGEWFLDRPTKTLDSEAVNIFRREFPDATQNWT